MVVYTLEERWKILRHYFENHVNIAECVRKLRTDFLKIALSAIELMPFGHLEAEI